MLDQKISNLEQMHSDLNAVNAERESLTGKVGCRYKKIVKLKMEEEKLNEGSEKEGGKKQRSESKKVPPLPQPPKPFLDPKVKGK